MIMTVTDHFFCLKVIPGKMKKIGLIFHIFYEFTNCIKVIENVTYCGVFCEREAMRLTMN